MEKILETRPGISFELLVAAPEISSSSSSSSLLPSLEMSDTQSLFRFAGGG
jgi:hypothetical protein